MGYGSVLVCGKKKHDKRAKRGGGATVAARTATFFPSLNTARASNGDRNGRARWIVALRPSFLLYMMFQVV